MTTYYIAGPMSGLPQFNYPKFMEVAKQLREAYPEDTFLNPMELDDPATVKQALASETGDANDVSATWGDFLSRDVKLIADRCDGVICLDDWGRSRGARLEVFTAITKGIPVYGLRVGTSFEPISPLVALEVMTMYLTATPENIERYKDSYNV